MAENKDNQQDKDQGSLENELDMILDNAATSASDDNENSLMNDDDAIDQLLMDDEFSDIDEFSEEGDEFLAQSPVDKLIGDDLADQLKEDDDLADVNQLFEDVTRLEENETFVKGKKLDENLPEPELDPELDLKSELDRELGEEESLQNIGSENETEDKLTDEDIDALTEDTFELDDQSEFDISTDDDTVVMPIQEDDELAELVDDELSGVAEEEQVDEFSVDNEFDLSDDQDSLETEENELEPESESEAEVSAAPVIEPSDELNEDASAAVTEQLDDLKAQIMQLKAEQEVLKEELAEYTPAVEPALNEESTKVIEQLQADQKKIRKIQSINSKKKPVLSYIALALGIIALIVAVIIAYMGIDSNTVISELSEQVSIMLEQDTYKEVNVVKQNQENAESKLESLDKRVLQLINKAKLNETGAVVVSLRDDVAVLLTQQEKMNTELVQLQETIKKLKKGRFVRTKKTVKKVIKPDWSVILVSFKQAWYAKRKAAEFAKQRVDAEVVPVQVKGDTWHRLRVKGFKTKEKALAYAEELKKKLNLTSVWVTKK